MSKLKYDLSDTPIRPVYKPEIIIPDTLKEVIKPKEHKPDVKVKLGDKIGDWIAEAYVSVKIFLGGTVEIAKAVNNISSGKLLWSSIWIVVAIAGIIVLVALLI